MLGSWVLEYEVASKRQGLARVKGFRECPEGRTLFVVEMKKEGYDAAI
jgi:hypothetical protein